MSGHGRLRNHGASEGPAVVRDNQENHGSDYSSEAHEETPTSARDVRSAPETLWKRLQISSVLGRTDVGEGRAECAGKLEDEPLTLGARLEEPGTVGAGTRHQGKRLRYSGVGRDSAKTQQTGRLCKHWIE